MKSSPIGGIFGNKMSNDTKYANVVLESLSVLDTTKDIFLRQNNPYINQTFLTKQFLSLLNILHNSPNDACSLEIINNYYNIAKSTNDNNSLYQYPYNFLVFFLQFLEDEYNRAFNIQKKFAVDSFRDIEKAVSEIKAYTDSLSNSMIFKNFSFSLILNTNCSSCATSKYMGVFRKTLNLNIDELKQSKNGVLTLNESLQLYSNGKYDKCQNCGNNYSVEKRTFINTGKVLIINLMRRNMTGNTDPFFKIDLNINISFLKKDPLASPENNYTLKSRICFGGQQFGFFVDCFVKKEKRIDEPKEEKKEEPEKKEDKKEENKTILETSKKEEITISASRELPKETKTTITTTTTSITSTEKEEPKKANENKEEEKTTQQPQNFMYYPMMIYQGGQNSNMPAMPMPMPMPAQEGDKNAQQQPMIYMVPVCFVDPSKMPKDMKMPNMPNNMPFPFYPYPMAYPQSNPETK